MLTSHDNTVFTHDVRESSTHSHQRAHSEIVHMLYDNSNEDDEKKSDNRYYSYSGNNNNNNNNNNNYSRDNYEAQSKKTNFAKSYIGHVHQVPFHKSTTDYGVRRTLPRVYNLSKTKNKFNNNKNNNSINSNNNVFNSTSNLWRLHIRTSPSFNIQQTAPKPYLLACAEMNSSLLD